MTAKMRVAGDAIGRDRGRAIDLTIDALRGEIAAER
jgi:hypothetical protein